MPTYQNLLLTGLFKGFAIDSYAATANIFCWMFLISRGHKCTTGGTISGALRYFLCVDLEYLHVHNLYLLFIITFLII